jgi:hypothetical protein
VNHLIDLYEMTPPGMIFLFVVWYLVSLYIMLRIGCLWFRKNLERCVEEFRRGYVTRIAELEGKLKEYERTHRTMV